MSIKIFDIEGKEAWEYTGSDKMTVWNCRDGKNIVVETGIYIYSIRIENKTYNGTINIAK